MPSPIDPGSPVPLYHQIAESIRAALESGALKPGDTLTPLRQAADEWGVNLHTVRHAYTALTREGLLEAGKGARRTRVAGGAHKAPAGRAASKAAFVARLLAEARDHHGLAPDDLVEEIQRWPADPGPQVYVVECSRWQAECHAEELARRYRVDAIPWPLEDGEPPDGTVMATYFHYNDVRKLWPQRLGSTHFISIHPDPALRDMLAAAPSVWVCELDEATAEVVSADLSALFGTIGPTIRRKVAANPNLSTPGLDDEAAPHLYPPRAWAALGEEGRSHPLGYELRYVLHPDELRSLAHEKGWQPISPTDEEPVQ